MFSIPKIYWRLKTFFFVNIFFILQVNCTLVIYASEIDDTTNKLYLYIDKIILVHYYIS